MAFIIGKCQLFIPEMCIGVLTTFIQACSLNRKRKAQKITCLYPLEIPDLKHPDAFGIPIVSTPLAFGIPVQRTPPCLRNSKKPSVVLYGYFLELPNAEGLVESAVELQELKPFLICPKVIFLLMLPLII